jgi:hypothetical protein
MKAWFRPFLFSANFLISHYFSIYFYMQDTTGRWELVSFLIL